MKLNEALSISIFEKGFLIVKLESQNLNLETLQLIPQGLEKVKQFSNLNGVVLYIEKLKGPSFHDFNLYIQKEGLLSNYIDAGRNCILSFNNLNLPFAIYIEKFASDMSCEFLINVPQVYFSPKAYIFWNYSQIPIFPLFGNIKNFFDFFGIERAFDFFLQGKVFLPKDLLLGFPIPKTFLLEGLDYYFKKYSERKSDKKFNLLQKFKDYLYWKKNKKFLKGEILELTENLINLYLKDKLSQEEEEIYQRDYLLKEMVQNKLRYLLVKEELFNLEVFEDIKLDKKFMVLGFSKEGKKLITKGIKKDFKVRILEKDQELLNENLPDIIENGFFSFANEYYGFENYPIIVENLNCKEEEKGEIISSISDNFEIEGILLISLKTISLKSIEKKYNHPTRILGYNIPISVEGNNFVEIIKGQRTSQESIKIASKFFSSLGYFPLVVSDKPGFLVLRIISFLLNETFYLLEEGWRPEILEKAFKINGFKKGPLQLGDEIGFSVLSSIVQINSIASKEFPPVNRIFSVLAELERFEKRFPIKFFFYKNGQVLKENKRLIKHLGLKFEKREVSEEELTELSERFLINLLNISFGSVEQGVVDWADKVDLALSFVLGKTTSNLGFIKHCDNIGWQHILGITQKLTSKYGTKYAPCKSIQELASAF